MLLMLVAAVLVGAVVGLAVVPGLLPKVPPDSKLRGLPVVGKLFPSDSGPSQWVSEGVVCPRLAKMVEELKAQKEKCDERAKLLDEREEIIRQQEQAVSEAEKELTAMRRDFERKFQEEYKKKFTAMVIELKASEMKNLKRLAKIYGQMKPDEAASLMKELEQETSVKILSLMKEREAGMILGAYAKMGEEEAKRAAEMSDAMRRVFATKEVAAK